MLKLGLKKKKKGKKKKDQELFTEEELEQYKREHQHHPPAETSAASEAADAADAAGEEQSDVLAGHEKDEEWSKFALLTTGVDSILKKTQGDLNRIKSTSFFKRAAPPVPQPPKEPEPEPPKPETPEEERKVKQLLGAVVELPDSEDESDQEADLAFAASYELPSAYVADLDDDEDQGDDPFDTGYADRVIKGPEVSSRGKKIINIGSAVGVLTGKVDTATTSIARPRRARRGIQNFLLESFEVADDESKDQLDGESSAEVAAASKTLLDEPAELDSAVPIDLSVSLHLQHKKKDGNDDEEKEPEIGDDILKIVDLKVRATTPQLAVTDEDDADWAEFEFKREEKGEKPARPLVSPRKVKLAPASNLAILLGEDESPEDFEDPFDTTYVEAIIPKAIDYDDDFDPRAAAAAAEEEERLRAEQAAKEAAEAKAKAEEGARLAAEAEAAANRLSDDEFDPRADEEVDIFDTSKASNVLRVFETQRDLLGASPNNSKAPTLAPSGELVDAEEEIDPFDTSAVDAIVVPGTTELKYLEKELLEDDDFDFDPRAGEEKPSVEDLRRRKSSLSLQLLTNSPKVGVSFAIPTPDLLKVDAETSNKIQKPLTPYYNRESSLPLEEEAVDEDPFDTSYVNVAPTTLELDILEKEILKQPEQQSLSDDDFDPRAVTPEPPRKAEDLLNAASESHDRKVLTPARGDSLSQEAAADPFDTSATASYQLRQLEDELIEKRPEPPAPTDILSDTQDNSIYDKILQPQSTSLDIDDEDDIDPFDTSFVPTLQPGETEIQLLENELIN